MKIVKMKCVIVLTVVFWSICSIGVCGAGSDGGIFYDDFNGLNFDFAKWTVTTDGIGPYTVDVHQADDMNFAHFESFCDGMTWGDVSIRSSTLTLTNPNEWAAEIRFRVGLWQDGRWLSRGAPTYLGPGTDLPRQVELLAGRRGLNDVGEFAVTLFEDWETWHSYYPDPVPEGQGSSTFYLAWSVFDGPTDANYIVPNNPAASKFNRGQWYKLVLHRKADGEIDIYLDDVLLITRSAFPGSLQSLEIGDTSGGTGLLLDVDYVKLGGFIGGEPLNCGDPGTTYLQSDLNTDCRVDFADFALFTESWLLCTDPEDPVNCIQ